MAIEKTVETLKVLDELDWLRHNHPEYDYAIRLAQAIVAKTAGCESRAEWSHLLYQDKSSKYYKYYENVDGVAMDLIIKNLRKKL